MDFSLVYDPAWTQPSADLHLNYPLLLTHALFIIGVWMMIYGAGVCFYSTMT